MRRQTNSDPTTVTEMRGQVIRDLKDLVADTEHLLKEVLRASGEEITTAGASIDDRLGNVRARMIRARAAASRGVGEAADITQKYAVDHPWKVLGVAAVAGLIIGAMLRSR